MTVHNQFDILPIQITICIWKKMVEAGSAPALVKHINEGPSKSLYVKQQ